MPIVWIEADVHCPAGSAMLYNNTNTHARGLLPAVSNLSSGVLNGLDVLKERIVADSSCNIRSSVAEPVMSNNDIGHLAEPSSSFKELLRWTPASNKLSSELLITERSELKVKSNLLESSKLQEKLQLLACDIGHAR